MVFPSAFKFGVVDENSEEPGFVMKEKRECAKGDGKRQKDEAKKRLLLLLPEALTCPVNKSYAHSGSRPE
jgi:hypothetical protein